MNVWHSKAGMNLSWWLDIMYSGVFAMKIYFWHILAILAYNKLAILASCTTTENSVDAPCWDSSIHNCACIRCCLAWMHSFLSLPSRSPSSFKLTAATHGYNGCHRPFPYTYIKGARHVCIWCAVLSVLAAFSCCTFLSPNTMTPSGLVSLMSPLSKWHWRQNNFFHFGQDWLHGSCSWFTMKKACRKSSKSEPA